MSSQPSAQKVTLDTLSADGSSGAGDPPGQLEDVADLPVTLAMEVGRTTVTIRELLQLAAGSVVELDRDIGEAFDVYVNGTMLAHGEAVVVNEKCGVRLTDVIRPAERIRHASR